MTTCLAAALIAAAAHGVSGTANAAPANCPWTVSPVTSGLGSLENLGFDGTGRMLLSRTDDRAGQLYRMTPDGGGTTLAADIDSPGGIAVEGGTAYFTTGNSFGAGALGRKTGTIEAIDLATGSTRTVASGLTMPNGMARLPDGRFVVSRNLGLRTGLTMVSADGSSTVPFAPTVNTTNGVAYDAGRNAVVTSVDLSPVATLALIDLSDPRRVTRINLGLFGLLGFPDDLTIGADDMIYLAMDGGSVVRVDPANKTACVLASKMPGTTSVRFGAGPGWDPAALYATSLSGSVTKLSPGA